MSFTHTQLVDALVKTHCHYVLKKRPSDDNLVTAIVDAINSKTHAKAFRTDTGQIIHAPVTPLDEVAKIVLDALRSAGVKL